MNKALKSPIRVASLTIAALAAYMLTLAGLLLFVNQAAAKQPNILLIMADDMGYSDLACYGGEIDTPNLDRLASGGVRFTQFYTTSKCVPTRASVMTGLYPHQVGMGWMEGSNMGFPGYVGDLYNNCVTTAQLLGSQGYKTFMTGKWHLTYYKYLTPKGPKHNWPSQRGFQKFYGTIHGSAVYFSLRGLTEGNRAVDPPKGKYYTDVISDKTVQFIYEHNVESPESSFYAYVAYTAPHFPLKAKTKDIAKYLGKYLDGWESKRKDRYDRMVKMQIIDPAWALSEKDAPDWDSLSDNEKKLWDKRMAIYAAQIDCMDQGIGRIITAVEETGQLDNTLIIFLSDNGATDHMFGKNVVTGQDVLGTEKSYDSVRAPWANLSNTPWRRYKEQSHEGGIAAPFIAHWPDKIKNNGSIVKTAAHVIDLMPTFLDVAGVKYPEKFGDYSILPMEGKSLHGALLGEKQNKDRTLYFEHLASWAIRSGDWKLVNYSERGERELYNMVTDRSEMNDLITDKPELAEELFKKWDIWAKRCNVYPLSKSRKWNISQDPYRKTWDSK